MDSSEQRIAKNTYPIFPGMLTLGKIFENSKNRGREKEKRITGNGNKQVAETSSRMLVQVSLD